MDLNHVELSPSMLASLYKSSLIESEIIPGTKKAGQINDIAEKSAKPIPAETASWKWLGNNLKHIIIVVNNREVVYLPDNELTFLTGILTACKLTIADVAIINLNNYPQVSYKELTSFFKSRIVLLFDIEPTSFGLPIDFPKYQLQSFAGNTFLYSSSLNDLENDKLEKSKLWVSLKRLFNL